MTNILLELIEHKIEHFITKSYLTCKFDEDESRAEYHVYFKFSDKSRTAFKNRKNLDKKDAVGFTCSKLKDFPYLKFKKLIRIENSFFNKSRHLYNEVHSDRNGSVFNHKEVGFKKESSIS